MAVTTADAAGIDLRQGDVYQKIIEEVVLASTNDFEESGVGQTTLNELRQVGRCPSHIRQQNSTILSFSSSLHQRDLQKVDTMGVVEDMAISCRLAAKFVEGAPGSQTGIQRG